VEEKVAGGLLSDTATGRTSDVTGSVTVVGSRVTAANFTVNMTTLKSDKSLRDTVLKTNAIQTAKFPTAAFTLTDPISLPDITPGKVYGVDAHGTLLLHGVSKSVTVALHYQQTNAGFVLLADTPIVMADYAITPPNIAGVVSVQDHGTFELLMNLEK
jgi:polyisoprenoid-binding protein YceI